jgi:hypothetical protein
MAQTVIVKLTDDLDGGDADETVSSSLDGRSYEIDVNKKNADRIRKAFQPFIDRARSSSRGANPGRSRRSSNRLPTSGSKTLFSQLDSEEKDRFRVWANMPTARRIGDVRVQEWMDSGRP